MMSMSYEIAEKVMALLKARKFDHGQVAWPPHRSGSANPKSAGTRHKMQHVSKVCLDPSCDQPAVSAVTWPTEDGRRIGGLTHKVVSQVQSCPSM